MDLSIVLCRWFSVACASTLAFFGLALMKDGFKPLRSMPEFIEMFSRFSPTGYFDYVNIIKCVFVGAILTAIVQSSSATLGITIGLASIGAAITAAKKTDQQKYHPPTYYGQISHCVSLLAG